MPSDEQIERMLERVDGGSESAFEELCQFFRPRLRKAISARMDGRLASRLDLSDVVQEVLIVAWRRLPQYLEHRPVPFYVWLRRLALDQLARLHRHHITTKCRSVARETSLRYSAESLSQLTSQLMASSLGGQLSLAELLERVEIALTRLIKADRELLIMKYIEGMTLAEIAAVLDCTEAAAKTRHVRALSRLGSELARFGDLP